MCALNVRLSVARSGLPAPGHAYRTSAMPLQEEREGADEDLV